MVIILKEKQAEFIEALTQWSLCSLFLFPILPLGVENVLFIIFNFLVIVSWFFKKAEGIWRHIKKNITLSLPFVPYIIEFILYHDNRIAGFELEKKLLFFIAPIVLGLYIAIYKPKNFRVYMYCFAGSLTILAFYTLLLLLYKGILFSPISLENGARIMRQEFENLSHLHPTYFSLFATISILWFIYDYQNQPALVKLLYCISGTLLFTAELVVASRMPLIALVISTLFLLYKLSINKKWLLYKYGILIACAAVITLTVPTIKNRVSDINPFYKYNNNLPKVFHEREAILDCSLETFKDNIWTGTGNRNSQNILDVCYTGKNFQKAIKQPFNAHNQFLTIGINYGIFFMMLFIGTLLYLIKKAWKNYFTLAFIISTVLVMLTESILERQWGVYFYVLFSILLVNIESLKEEKLIEAGTTTLN